MGTITSALAWLLGIVFLAAGGMKAAMPEEKLLANPQMGWIERTGIQQARLAGAAEVAAALAFLGGALDITPLWLSGVAAIGIVVLMVLAARVHLAASEPVVPNIALGALAAVLAVGALVG